MLKNSLNKFAKSVLLSSFLLGSHLLASEVTQIRNATVKINYGGKVFLVDPMFAPKDAYKGFEGTLNSHLNWPRVELPFSKNEILKDVDAVIITHTHLDHLDETAIKAIPKDILMFSQDEKDKAYLEKSGFKNVKIMTKNSSFGDVKLSITGGLHGSQELVFKYKELLGKVSGVVFSAKNEKTIYLAGDTVFNKDVEDVIKNYNPEIIILNSGDAQLGDGSSILMTKEEVLATHKVAPKAKIIAVHMEAVNHSALSRYELKEYSKQKGMEDFVFIPKDGESLKF
ncbi:MBL fold metallo-hydrolase [Aliarcobacter skirrowii]|jgi:L-ascorbate metabolism protein UlaG (beta-lactamase superfamily)|uniref:MBL fold metallo-hydrolase n=1 Tax=Aliarcobacter TaxID=2321111 RepID=UPI0029B01D8E|nr:MBL fold metallo-hydrolase [Aliarcobacter skirrowii]MDX4011535.1 MBL fold metallo-hydrolase [Aliarcobacter skirrowii]MDX4026266.1 MBL fold metallo-hydrolase [Aliarcobacter skirrowii]MDX4034722.1 MBL fold metallo-hydrolase [Aliarcobacter skirrowii]MDX4048991.1 MBL fold metallo-hydrolase [Aliarcobacter skirrowii]MDX4065799.1 MBL fold metallo-hydrolase [Aliarcobacter skirrowii]